jgi:hypothetical protein
MDEDRPFAPEVDHHRCRRIGSQHHAAQLAFGHCCTSLGYQVIESQARPPGHRWLYRTDIALGKGDNLALKGQQHAGHRHDPNNQASQDPDHEV